MKTGTDDAIEISKALLSSKKLRNEILIAFCLIILTIIVLVGYLFPGVSGASWFSARGSLPLVMGIIATILIIGFMIILQIIEPVIRLSREAKMIAAGDLNREIRMAREDELGDLGSSVNALTRRIRENVEELKNLSKKTDSLNDEIKNRINMLSNLLEISNHIAQKSSLQDILDMVLHKTFTQQGMPFGAVVLRDPVSKEFSVQHFHVSHDKEEAFNKKGLKNMKIALGVGLLGKAILKQEVAVIDAKTPMTSEVEELRKMFMIKNAVISPISSTGNAYGLLVAGNEAEDYVCTETQRDLMQLVSKHVAIVLLNEMLAQEIERFEITDPLTGLFNSTYARSRLAIEVKQAVNFQKTCSFILLSLDRFKDYLQNCGHIGAEDVLIKTSQILKRMIPEGGKAARFAEHEFAVILPKINKKEAIKIAEDAVHEVAAMFKNETEPGHRLTATAAVVENPIDGRTSDELILKSGIILADHIEKGGNRVGF